MTKDGAGTATLAAANTYTGTTTVSNGTLQIGNGISGSLNGSNTGAALTFSGPGTANFNEAAATPRKPWAALSSLQAPATARCSPPTAAAATPA